MENEIIIFILVALLGGILAVTVVSYVGFALGALVCARTNPVAGGVGGACIACAFGGSVFFGQVGLFLGGFFGAVAGCAILHNQKTDEED